MAGEGYRSKYIIGLGKDGGSHKKTKKVITLSLN